MATFTIENFKYLVVDTGYTSRLVDDLSQIEEQLKEDLQYLCNSIEANCPHCNDLILYIEDSICGNGLYEVSPQKEEIEKIRTMISGEKFRGIIVLRCDNLRKVMTVVEVLQNQDYCCCFVMSHLYEMKIINEEVLLMRFGCGSR